MKFNQLAKWLAGGVVAVAAIPTVSYARSHRPVQAVPVSLMATATATPAATSARPVSLSATTVRKASGRVKRLSAHHKSHIHLIHKLHKASKLHVKHASHIRLSASRKHLPK